MPDMSCPVLGDLVTIDSRGLRAHLTVMMIDESCERYAQTRFAAQQDQLLLARHCRDTAPAAVEQLRADVEWLRDCLDAAVRHVDLFIDARPLGLSRASQRVAAVSAERVSTTVMSTLRALLDSESVVRCGHPRNSLRVSDGSALTARRVNAVLTQIEHAARDHRSVVAWLQHEQDNPAIRDARRLHRRATATATIDTLTLRTEARRQVA